MANIGGHIILGCHGQGGGFISGGCRGGMGMLAFGWGPQGTGGGWNMGRLQGPEGGGWFQGPARCLGVIAVSPVWPFEVEDFDPCRVIGPLTLGASNVCPVLCVEGPVGMTGIHSVGPLSGAGAGRPCTGW